ncbi:MAG: amidase [Alphaproteobacteria bacterium]|nr:amidase [Alphaproteobacteria bacterium]
MKPIRELAADLASGRTTSRVLLETCLANIFENGEGARAFRYVDPVKARAMADAMDALRAAGAPLSPFAGLPLSIKDLYDVHGEVTAAGSKALAEAPPAARDAPTIARMRQVGYVFVGRTNMVEFAYSGLGLNPHFGTPRSPWDRQTGRAPGGSSSGSAVSVADGMAAVTLGTDTGGSCRIPAAFCGITGYKPTAARVPLDGITPLSSSLDSAGPLGASVDCCAIVDAILAGEPVRDLTPIHAKGLRFAIPKTLVFEDVDATVAACFDRTIARLRDAGVRIDEIGFEVLGELPSINAKGGLAASEAFAYHHALLAEKGALYDPRVGERIKKGALQSAADYIAITRARRRIIAEADRLTAPYDAVLTPTVAIIPPTLKELEDDETYFRLNALVLRNTSVANFLDRCAISIPCHRVGDAPVGLSLMGRRGGDHALFDAAVTVETILAG